MTGLARRGRYASRIVLVGAVLVLGACSTEAGPTAEQPQEQAVTLDNLSRKIELVQHDVCYKKSAEHGTPGCDRYLVETRNIGNAAADADGASEEVISRGHALSQRVQQLYDNQCLPPRPANEQQCAQNLDEIGNAMDDLAAALPQ